MIGRITNQMSSQMTLSGIESALDRLDTTQQELSTGKSINQPSDNPSGTALTLQLNTQLSDLNSYSNKVTDGTGWSQASTSALTDITNAVQRIQELTTRGGQRHPDHRRYAGLRPGGQPADRRDQAGREHAVQRPVRVLGHRDLHAARTQSGSNDSYAGNTGQVTRTIGPNTTLAVNANLQSVLGTGQTVSGQPAGDGLLLNTLRNVADDMQSGNSTAVNSEMSALTTNLNSLTGLSANVGAVQDRLQMASSRIETMQTSDTQVLSNTQDADMASTEISYSTQQAALTAALQAGASIVQHSLMNFLGTTG